MAAIPITIVAMIYPRDKSTKPYPATIAGFGHITGLGVGSGPIDPPPDIPVQPPLVIWGGGGVGDYIDAGFPGPQPPPDQPPAAVEPPHEGWNWSAANSGWYFLYVPRPDSAAPKKK